MPAAAASATEVDSSAFDRLRAIYISDDAQLTLMTSTSISLLLSNRQDSCFRVDSINLQQLFFWLKVACRIDFKLAFLVYKCLHGLSPSYLAEELHHPAESEFWRRLRSILSHELSVPRIRSTVWRLSISSCHCMDPEQCSAAYHICSVTSHLLLSLEDILLRTLLPVITVIVRAKWRCHLWIC